MQMWEDWVYIKCNLKTRRPPIKTAQRAMVSYGQLRTAVGSYVYIKIVNNSWTYGADSYG